MPAPKLNSLRRFARDESGVMIAYSVFFFLIMLIVGGIGVDFMHFEMKRTRLQNTLDRAVLAAADLQQTLDPAAVVEDYLAKASINATLSSAPTVNTGLNFRDVAAHATLNVPTQFIHMLGIDTLSAPAAAQAEEKIEAVEIALVLDVSGSMRSNNRLVNLKPAAREFIDTMLGLAAPGDVNVSIIPYNTQVNAGETLLKHYNVSNEHSYSHCVNFDTADFGTAALMTAQSLERTMHFDMFTYSSGSFPPVASDLNSPICNTAAYSEIMTMEVNGTTLKNQIDALQAGGNTSIDIGMKWAATLLDPGTRPVITQMITDGDVDAVNAGKPLGYDEPNSLKVIVVMTDGQNTSQYMLPDHMRGTMSNVLYDTDSGRRSILVAHTDGTIEYFWVDDETMNPEPYGNHDPGPKTAVRLSYQQLFAYNSVASNARYTYGPYLGLGTAWDTWYTNLPDRVNGTEKDARLQSICSAVKDNNVVVYAIGFEATANGNAQLSKCASSPSHFFNATGVSITDVFQSIAVSIAQLRLTQ
ncbi:pilus assembly protein [Alisedimentitalea sp. MJ-SS2]|nr:pilus assembly protein [Alisedimentitalea sp. MJ-SS2]